MNAIGNLLPDGLFSRYVIGGLGYLRADAGLPDFGGAPAAGTAASHMTATAGLGLKIRFGDSPWSLRAEWRLRYAFDSDNSLTDQIGSLGDQYSFGGRPSEVAAVVSEPEAEAVAEPDADSDGAVDARDACPSRRQGVTVDAAGCPCVATASRSRLHRMRLHSVRPRTDASGCGCWRADRKSPGIAGIVR